jgi:hypothetical protein
MLWVMFLFLMTFWIIGMATSITLGGFIHMLLVVAIAILIIQIMEDRHVIRELQVRAYTSGLLGSRSPRPHQ